MLARTLSEQKDIQINQNIYINIIPEFNMKYIMNLIIKKIELTCGYMLVLSLEYYLLSIVSYSIVKFQTYFMSLFLDN